MDLEMQQLLPSSPAPADNINGASSGRREILLKAILVIRCMLVFTAGGGIHHSEAEAEGDPQYQGGSPSVSRVSSSKSIHKQTEFQTARTDSMESEAAVEDAQTAPLLQTKLVDNSMQRMRTLVHVLRSCQIFKAGANVHRDATERKPEEDAEASDSLAAWSEHHITIGQTSTNEMTINQLTLQQFGGIRGVEDALNTNVVTGITDDEAICRSGLQTFSPSRTSACKFSHLVLEALKRKTILLLSLGTALSLGFGIKEEGLENGWHDGVIVLITIIVLVFFDSIGKYRQEQRAQKKLEKQQTTKGIVGGVHVIRGGEAKNICESELVFGDVVLLKEGGRVPADGLLVALELDYGSESYVVDEQNPFLSYGDRVINGDARMVVMSKDIGTQWSEMMSKASSNPDTKFKLEAHFDKLNTCIQNTGLTISILILIVLFSRYMAGKMDEENGYRPESRPEPTAMRTFANSLRKIITESKHTTRALTKLGVSLVGVTEGVPFVVSLAIFYCNRHTLSSNATEQHSQFVAKMALATRICIDPFVNFTEDEMEVDKVVIGEVISGCTTLSPVVVEALPDGVDKTLCDNREVTKADVEACRERGIELVIVSRKELPLLSNIASQCGLITNGDSEPSMLTGEVFRKYPEEKRLKDVDKIHVMGEALPSDKHLLVESLRKKGQVVVNFRQRTDEAPALRDIGIAMGTRESSEIIIWDGSFVDLIRMVDSGKRLHKNIQSFLQAVLIMTISSNLINFCGTVALGDVPLTTFELVWVNLAVDFLGGLALLTKPLTSIDKPVSCTGSLISAVMTRNIVAQVLYQAICLVILRVTGSGAVVTSEEIKSMVSNIFILCQLFNLFNAREVENNNFLRGIHGLKEFWVGGGIFMVLQVALVWFEGILGCGARLNWKLWLGCLVIGAMSWLVDWLGKFTSRYLS